MIYSDLNSFRTSLLMLLRHTRGIMRASWQRFSSAKAAKARPSTAPQCGARASRFYRWRKAGIWQRLFEAVQQQADAAGKVAAS